MNSYERIINAFNGETVDRIAVAPIVREWCAKQVGFDFSDLTKSSVQNVFAQYYCANKYLFDALWDLWGIQAEAAVMGSAINIPKNMEGVPSVVTPAIKNYKKDLKKIKIPNPAKDGYLPIIMDGITQLKKLANEKMPVLGYVQGPFRMASMLRGPEKTMQDCADGRKELEELLEICTDTLIVSGAASVHAGADVLWIGEPTSSGDRISLEFLKRYVLPYLRILIKSLKNHRVKVMMHVCGDTSDRLELFRDAGIDALSISEKVDLSHARQVLGDSFCLWGNVAPSTLLSGTPQDVEKEAQDCLRKGVGKNGNFVLCSGCRTPPDAPPENIVAMVKAAHNF